MVYTTAKYPARLARVRKLAKLMRSVKREIRAFVALGWTSGMTKAYTDRLTAYDTEYVALLAKLPTTARSLTAR
jgi:hypothetical protein